jgi:hypothetical protein
MHNLQFIRDVLATAVEWGKLVHILNLVLLEGMTVRAPRDKRVEVIGLLPLGKSRRSWVIRIDSVGDVFFLGVTRDASSPQRVFLHSHGGCLFQTVNGEDTIFGSVNHLYRTLPWLEKPNTIIRLSANFDTSTVSIKVMDDEREIHLPVPDLATYQLFVRVYGQVTFLPDTS